jgi:hypothetical protein
MYYDDMKDETLSESEIMQRRQAALKRMFATPHKPHAMIKAKPKPKPSRPLIPVNKLHKRTDSRK